MGSSGSKGASEGSGKGPNKTGKSRRSKCGKQFCVVCNPSSPEYEDHLRLLGNACFRAGRYEDAIEMYTASIQRCQYNPTAYTNRGNTFMRLHQYEEAVEDCRIAVTLAPESIKAHYYLGQCLCELDSFEKGVWHLQESLRICKREGARFERDITAKLKYWQRQQLLSPKNNGKSSEMLLLAQLQQLIDADKKRKIEALQDRYFGGKKKLSGMNRKIMQEKIASVERETEILLQSTNNAFEKLQQTQPASQEIPEYMCCKISLCLMRDPVITPSGITYDRHNILEHLRRGNDFDPTTRLPLKEQELTANLALREATEDFLSRNPWALNDVDLNNP